MSARPWLELSRASNLPTVWSNVAAGLAWGLHSALHAHHPQLQGVSDPPAVPLTAILNEGFLLMLAASLMYVAGMMLNDVADARVDARERPLRPIPSGRISRRTAARVGTTLLILGVLAALPYTQSPWTLPLLATLVGLIALYNLTHTRWAGAVVLLPLCRASLALLAAMTVAAGTWTPTPVAFLHAAALFVYVLMISLLARHEIQHDRTRYVATLVAGIAMLDALLMAAIGQRTLALFCAACFVTARLGQRRLPGS